MSRHAHAVRATALALVLAATGACSAADPPARPVAVAATVPAPSTVTGTPSQQPGPVPSGAPTLLSPAPAAGTVTQVAGPFDDRFTMTSRLTAGGLEAEVRITADVSDLIVLELQADFYDAGGRLLATERVTHREDHGEADSHEGGVHLVVPADAGYRSRVASATVSVPVLVNE